jgi:DNA-binding response OmpR family regulator
MLDSRFPDGDGLDLCRGLREYAPNTPIVFYSGDARETDKQKGLSAGASAYLVKPDFDNLASSILNLTNGSK